MITESVQDFSKLLKYEKPIIAIDYGQKKIGLAISNQKHTIAMPLAILRESESNVQIQKILSIIKQHSAHGIVIGLPISMNGESNKQTQIVTNFAKNLNQLIDLPIYLQDERLSSKSANNILKSIGSNRKMRNAVDDSIAASLILETVLNFMQLQN